MSADAALAAQFEADHRHLRGVAYRLTGSWPDAEDALQRAWLAASQANLDEVGNLTGWLTTVTARECLTILRSRRRRREVPLPDEAALASAGPVPAADEAAILAEEVGLALLVVLDRLSPAQRVAFVLHDLFRVPFEDIARVLRRSPAAAKKLASRARERVHGDPPPARPLTAESTRLAEAFLAAARGGDIGALLGLLAPDVVRRVEPGLVPAAVPAEVAGARAVAEETRRFAARARDSAVVLIDGAPGIVIAPRGRLQIILRLTIRAGRISEIDIRGSAESLAEASIGLPPGAG
jgi:RNA polymerase sigma-70 factor, ECF subfamily